MMQPSTDTRHVMVVVNDLEPYGSQRVALTLVRSLLCEGRKVTLVTLEQPSAKELMIPMGARRVALRRPGIRGAAAYMVTVLAVARVLRGLRPDLVISHMLLSNVTVLAAATLLLRPPRILVTEHSSVRNLQTERSARALEALARRLYPRAYRVLGVSQGVVDEVRAFYGLRRDRVLCVWNPVDVPQIRADAKEDPKHQWLPSDGDHTTVVCVGGLRRVKGQDILLRSLSYVPSVRLVCLGAGPMMEEYRRLARDLGVAERVDFVGFQQNSSAFVSRSDALVMPSRWEGFGLVAVEAAAVGVPVIATDVLGVRELVGGRVPGLLVPAEHPEALANALQLLVDGVLVVGKADFTDFRPDATVKRYLAAGE